MGTQSVFLLSLVSYPTCGEILPTIGRSSCNHRCVRNSPYSSLDTSLSAITMWNSGFASLRKVRPKLGTPFWNRQIREVLSIVRCEGLAVDGVERNRGSLANTAQW